MDNNDLSQDAIKSIKASEARYRALFENTKDALLVIEGPPWHFTQVNAAAVKLFGAAAAIEITGAPLGSLSTEKQPDGTLSALKLAKIADATIKGGSTLCEWTCKRIKGGTFPGSFLLTSVDIGGRPVLLLCARDITELKTTEATLRNSEAMFKCTFENHAAVKLLLDPETGAILDANYAAASYYGWPREQLLRMNIEQINTLPLSKIKEKMTEVKAAGHIHFDFQHRLADGSVRDVEVFSSRMEVNGRTMLHSIVHDVTERRKAETAMKESEAKYRHIFQNVLDVFYHADNDGLITEITPSIQKYSGYSREELLGKPISPFYTNPAARERLRERLGREGEVTGYEITLQKKDGSLAYCSLNAQLTFDQHGIATGMDGSLHDITPQIKAKHDLREAYEMQGALNSMLKHSLENLPLKDKLKRHLAALLSAPWLSAQGKGAVFLAGHTPRKMELAAQEGLSPEMLAVCTKAPACEGPQDQGRYCVPITAGGKNLGWLNLYLNGGNELPPNQQGFIKAAADIMAENILNAQTEEKFTHSQKMEAVGVLAGGVAHDFNNILTAIECYGRFIQKGLSPLDQKYKDAQEILSAAERAGQLTRQLLAFSRKQILAPRVMDLNRITGDMTNMLRRIIGEKIKLNVSLAPAECLVLVDPGQMEQVIMNLAVNARDAMPDGGSILLETSILQVPDAPPSATDRRPGPQVCLKLSDTGSGIDDETKKRIFEPFFTTKGQGKGTGLGLSTVFGIVKQSGGDIEVESEPGKGTTFIICLHMAEPVQGMEAGKAVPGVTKGSETILLVEDEEDLRHIGKRVMEEAGYSVIVAAGGDEALKTLELHGKPVDLLVTDVVMPGMSGRDLAKEVARRKLAKRTLYMSGYTDDAIVEHGVLEPGLAFIYKPFSFESMSAKVREVLDGPEDKAKA